jgi:hypothetical protein
MASVDWAAHAEESITPLSDDLKIYGAWGMLRAMLRDFGVSSPTLEEVRAAYFAADKIINPE